MMKNLCVEKQESEYGEERKMDILTILSISGLTEQHSLNFWNVLTMYQNKNTLPFSDFERHHINIPFSMERLNVRIRDIFYMLDEKYHQTNPT